MKTIIMLMVAWFCLLQSATAAEQLPPEVLKALQQSPRIELLSLDGVDFEPHVDPRGLPRDGTYYRQHIYGRVMLSGQDQQTLVAALQRGVAGGSAEEHGCFQPRHGIRVLADGHIYDLVICFQCSQMYLYRDGHGIGRVGTDDKPHRAFNAMLVAHHTPLPLYGNETISTLNPSEMYWFMVDDSTLFHWNDLPPDVAHKVQAHLRDRLGAFASRLAFGGGRKSSSGYTVELCFRLPDKGLNLVVETLQIQPDGTLAREVPMPGLAAHPDKAIRLTVREAIAKAASHGLSLADNYNVSFNYDVPHDDWTYMVSGRSQDEKFLTVSVSASSGQILRIRTVPPHGPRVLYRTSDMASASVRCNSASTLANF